MSTSGQPSVAAFSKQNLLEQLVLSFRQQSNLFEEPSSALLSEAVYQRAQRRAAVDHKLVTECIEYMDKHGMSPGHGGGQVQQKRLPPRADAECHSQAPAPHGLRFCFSCFSCFSCCSLLLFLLLLLLLCRSFLSQFQWSFRKNKFRPLLLLRMQRPRMHERSRQNFQGGAPGAGAPSAAHWQGCRVPRIKLGEAYGGFLAWSGPGCGGRGVGGLAFSCLPAPPRPQPAAAGTARGCRQ